MDQTADIGMQFPGVHINCGGGSDDPFTKMEGDMESKHLPLRACFVTDSYREMCMLKIYPSQYWNV